MYQFIHAEVYARRASSNPKNKTEYSIDDIIGEAIRDPAHSGAVANPQPPRYIISSEEGLKEHASKDKRKRREISRSHRSKNEGRRSCFSSGGCFIPEVEAEKRPRALCPVGVINYCLSQGKYGDNLRAVVMHNDEEQPHLHFSYAPIPKLMPRHYITDTRQKRIS